MADSETVKRMPEGGPSAAEIAAYLRAHPGFLAEHPDLASILTPPDFRRADGTLDLQRYLLQRLQGDIAKLRTAQAEIIAATRANLSSQSRIHASVITMLGATTLEHLVEVITTDLAVHLELDAVALAFEALDRIPPGGHGTRIRLLPRGTIDRLIEPSNGKTGARQGVRLLADSPGEATVFGGLAPLVRSQALLRLDLRRDAPLGLLAFGSRTPGHFNPGQGTELLQFLGRVVELSIRSWLDRG